VNYVKSLKKYFSHNKTHLFPYLHVSPGTHTLTYQNRAVHGHTKIFVIHLSKCTIIVSGQCLSWSKLIENTPLTSQN